MYQIAAQKFNLAELLLRLGMLGGRDLSVGTGYFQKINAIPNLAKGVMNRTYVGLMRIDII